MSEHVDHELQAWMADWHADSAPVAPAAQVRQIVKRRTWQLGAWVTGEVTIGAAALTFLMHRVWTETDLLERVAMGLLALVTSCALLFTWWNWRGALGARAERTVIHLALTIERSRRFARAVRAGWVLLALELAIFAPWVAYRLHGDGRVATGANGLFAWGLLAGMTAAGAAGLIALGRWTARDARVLDQLRRELGDEGAADH